VQLGLKGVEKVVEYRLSETEAESLRLSAQGVKENIAKLGL
jgi:malate/lactate dehydrogenase